MTGNNWNNYFYSELKNNRMDLNDNLGTKGFQFVKNIQEYIIIIIIISRYASMQKNMPIFQV